MNALRTERAQSSGVRDSTAHPLHLEANRMALYRAVRDASRILPEKSRSIVGSCLLGEACKQAQRLRVTCWCDELRISIDVPSVVHEGGQFAIPANLLRAFLHGAGPEKVELRRESMQNKQRIRITCGKGRFDLDEQSLDELPDSENEDQLDSLTPLSVNVSWLKGSLIMLHRAIAWMPQDPEWERGVLIDIHDEAGEFVAMSRNQLAVTHRPAPGVEKLRAMIPTKTVGVLVDTPLSNRGTDQAAVRMGNTAMLISVGPMEIYSKLLKVEHYPDWAPRLLPKEANPPIHLDRKALLGVIGRMCVAASLTRGWRYSGYDAGPMEFRPAALGPAVCALEANSITFECRVHNQIQSVETISGQYDGAAIKGIYSVWQLRRVLDTMRTQSVSLQVAEEMGPCVISSNEAPDFQCVLSPIWSS